MSISHIKIITYPNLLDENSYDKKKFENYNEYKWSCATHKKYDTYQSVIDRDDFNDIPDINFLCIPLNENTILPSKLKTLECRYTHHDIYNLDNEFDHVPITHTLPENLPETLEWLNCSNNRFKKIPTLPPNLKTLVCYDNHLKKIPELPNNFKYLCCEYNQLTALPNLPNSTHGLLCNYNKITLLPPLSLNLVILECHNNQITELPELPPNLELLNFEYNQVKILPKLPPKLKILKFTNNKISKLPEVPKTLQMLWCGNNNIKVFPDSIQYVDFHKPNHEYRMLECRYFGNCFVKSPWQANFLCGKSHCYSGHDGNERYRDAYGPIYEFIDVYCARDFVKYVKYKKVIQKIEKWFLDCKYNPKYRYCQRKVMKDYNGLYKN